MSEIPRELSWLGCQFPSPKLTRDEQFIVRLGRKYGLSRLLDMQLTDCIKFIHAEKNCVCIITRLGDLYVETRDWVAIEANLHYRRKRLIRAGIVPPTSGPMFYNVLGADGNRLHSPQPVTVEGICERAPLYLQN